MNTYSSSVSSNLLFNLISNKNSIYTKKSHNNSHMCSSERIKDSNTMSYNNNIIKNCIL